MLVVTQDLGEALNGLSYRDWIDWAVCVLSDVSSGCPAESY